MKKISLVLIVVIIVALALTYFLIPDTIVVNRKIYITLKPPAVIRCLHDDSKWVNWFPDKSANQNNFNYNNEQYQLGEKEYNSINISISHENNTYASVINVIPAGIDSSVLEWQLQSTAGNNLFKRIKQFQNAKKIKANMNVLLDSFKTFVENTKNIYDYSINYTTLEDTALVSIKTHTNIYPSTQLIYSLVDELKKYIAEQHAIVNNFPMLNITQLIDSSYEIMVGVPTNILLNGTGKIQPKRMIRLKDKTLTTEIIGDNNKVKKGLQAISLYMDDNRLSSPVIPFQQLVTDRRQQQDSAKWITRIFTPII